MNGINYNKGNLKGCLPLDGRTPSPCCLDDFTTPNEARYKN